MPRGLPRWVSWRRWGHLAVGLALAGCGSNSHDQAVESAAAEAPPVPAVSTPAASTPADKRELARLAMREAGATSEQAREALADPDRYGQVNSIHLLYLMRRQPWAVELVEAIWLEDAAVQAELGWEPGPRPAERIAAALTLSRISPDSRWQYLPYVRGQLAHPDDFVRAQAAVALGFVGSDEDVPRLESLARSETRYGAESAIKALAIQGSEAAKQALLELRQDHAGDPERRVVIHRMLVEQFPEAVGGAAAPAYGQSP